MTDQELEQLEALLDDPSVTVFGQVSDTEVVLLRPMLSAAYVRRRCPDDTGRYENYPAAVRIEMVPQDRVELGWLQDHDRKLLDKAVEADKE